MALPRIIPRAPLTRSQQVEKMVVDALVKHRPVLDSDIDLRSIIIDVKLSRDGKQVRAVLVQYSSEYQADHPSS